MYKNEFPSREELARMVLELSDEALAYVRLPILGAYYYTDVRDHDRVTDEDVERYSLIGAVAHDSLNLVQLTCMMNYAFYRDELKKKNLQGMR